MSAAGQTHISAFAAYLAGERNYAPSTVLAYRKSLEELQKLLADKPLDTVQPQGIRLAVAKLASTGRKPRSIARALSAWRSFYRWAGRHRGFAANPAAGIRAPKASKPLPKALSVDHAMALLDRAAPDPADLAEVRDAAMFELFYSSGLRLSELIGLDDAPLAGSLGWVDAAAGEVTVTGEGRKTRTVPVGGTALAALQRWRALRTTWLRDDSPALFLSPRGKRVSPSLVYARLKRWTLKAGVPTHVHPHMLRHSFATHMLQSTGDLRAVQELLGHANITTTQVYTHLDFQALAKVYDQAHPRAKLVDPSTSRAKLVDPGTSRAKLVDKKRK